MESQELISAYNKLRSDVTAAEIHLEDMENSGFSRAIVSTARRSLNAAMHGLDRFLQENKESIQRLLPDCIW